MKLGELAQQRAASDAVKEFGRRMATDHQKAYDELSQIASQKEAFRKEANSGKDPDVKAWAAKTLPTLQEHQQQAKQAYASVQGRSSPSASPSQK